MIRKRSHPFVHLLQSTNQSSISLFNFQKGKTKAEKEQRRHCLQRLHYDAAKICNTIQAYSLENTLSAEKHNITEKFYEEKIGKPNA